MVRQNKNRSNARRLATKVNHLKNVEKPLQVRGRADPPSYVQLPWWQIVVSDNPLLDSKSNSKEYHGTDIFAIFKAQVANIAGLTFTGEYFSFRIQRIDVWEMTGKDLGMQVADFGFGFASADFMFQAVDHPGRNRWAHISFIPPKSQQNLILAGNDSEKLLVVSSTETAAKYECRFHLLWKFRHQTLPNRNLAGLFRRLQLEDAADQ